MYTVKFTDNTTQLDYNLTFAATENTLIICDNDAPTNTPCKHFYKVVKDYGYVYKLQKTQVKAIDGANGLYKFLVDCFENRFCEVFAKNVLIGCLTRVKEQK